MKNTDTERAELYDKAVLYARINPSISYVSRKLGIGFVKTRELLEQAVNARDIPDYSGRRLDDYEKPLRDRIAELEAELEAIGAGGVEPLRKQAAAPQAAQAAVPVVRGEVLVTVSGFTGSGKSAIAGEIEIMCRALGLQVEWPDGVTEKNMTHADWTTALELYNPRVRIIERNVPRNTASGADQ